MPRKETKILVTILIVLDLMAVIFFIILFSFTQNQISDTVLKTEEIKAAIKERETLYLMKNDITYGKDYENNLSQYIIGKNDIAGLIKIIEGLATSSNLKFEINSIGNEPSTKLSPIGAELVKMNITASGEWKNLQFFLNLLENYPLKISITNLSLARSGLNVRKAPLWSGTFEFTVVKLKDI